MHRWVDDQRDGVEPTTLAIRWRNLRPFFSWWAKEDGAPNPFTDADVPTAPDDRPPPVIHLDDIRVLLDIGKGRDVDDRRDTAIIRVLFDTGARLGELVALGVEDGDRRIDHLTLRGKTVMDRPRALRRRVSRWPATSGSALSTRVPSCRRCGWAARAHEARA